MNKSLELPRSTPEEQGMCSSAVISFLNGLAARNIEMHGLMIIRNGHVVTEGWWEPYRPELPHILNSVTKSFTSTAVGFMVQEGLLTVEDPVVPYFENELSRSERENMAGLQVKHLLTMSTGHTEDTTRFNLSSSFLTYSLTPYVGDRKDGDWVKGFFALPLKKTPGTHFLYNSGASHLLSVIVERVTGQALPDFLQTRLFEPLGIRRPKWDCSPTGEAAGGWGLRLSTEDIARFGLLLLNKGMWNGQRLLSEAWIDAATSKQVETPFNTVKPDWSQGYGYQFWRCRHDAFRADGAFGQYVVVLPKSDTVIAIHSCTKDMQIVLNLIWEHLLPAMREERLAADPGINGMLRRRLDSLSVLTDKSSVKLIPLSDQQYRLAANEDNIQTIRFCFNHERLELTWLDEKGEHKLECGIDRWIDGNSLGGEPASARGYWLDRYTFILDVCRVHTPHCDRMQFRFEGRKITLQYKHIDFIHKERSLTGWRVE